MCQSFPVIRVRSRAAISSLSSATLTIYSARGHNLACGLLFKLIRTEGVCPVLRIVLYLGFRNSPNKVPFVCFQPSALTKSLGVTCQACAMRLRIVQKSGLSLHSGHNSTRVPNLSSRDHPINSPIVRSRMTARSLASSFEPGADHSFIASQWLAEKPISMRCAAVVRLRRSWQDWSLTSPGGVTTLIQRRSESNID